MVGSSAIWLNKTLAVTGVACSIRRAEGHPGEIPTEGEISDNSRTCLGLLAKQAQRLDKAPFI